MIEWMKLTSMAYSLVKMICADHVKHTAEKVANIISIILINKKNDSEKTKHRLISGTLYFGECVSKALQKKWNIY